MRAVMHVEVSKLLAVWRLRAVLLVVVLASPLVLVVLTLQSGLPTDTLYGRWVQDIGLTFPLVLLGSAGVWAVPVLAALVAGDLMSSEDAHGTWSTVLTRSQRPWQLFWGKVCVAGLATIGLVSALAVSATLSGMALVGTQDLIGLTGQPIAFGDGAGLVLFAWLSTLPTALAISAGAVLVSVLTRSSLLGVAIPSVVAGALGLAGLLAPLGSLRPLLLAPGLSAWHGLLAEEAEVGPVIASAIVAAGYGALFLGTAVLVLRRRDWAVP